MVKSSGNFIFVIIHRLSKKIIVIIYNIIYFTI